MNSVLQGLKFTYAALLVLGLCILVWPEKPAMCLVGRGEWTFAGGAISNVLPNSLELRNDILRSPDLVCWHLYQTGPDSVPGMVESSAFVAPAFLAIPIGGFPGEGDGAEIYLEKIETGERLIVANARMNTQWAEVDLRVPHPFRGARVRLVAVSPFSSGYVRIGTPFAISLAGYLKSRALGLTALHAIGSCCIFMLFILGCLAARRLFPERYVFPAGISFACLVGYLTFFVFYLNLMLGRLISGVILAAGAVVMWRIRMTRGGSFRQHAEVTAYFISWFLVSVFYVQVLYMCDTGAGSWHANARYTPARWSTDNQIPMIVAEHVTHGASLKGILRPWKVSDRPPLQAGLMSLARLPTQLLATFGLPGNLIQYYYHILGIVINSLWAPALLYGLRLAGIRLSLAAACVLVAAFLPFTIFNTTYVWPKLLAGSLAFLAFVVLADRMDKKDEAFPGSTAVFYLSAMLASLSLMAHSGTVTGLLVIGMWPLVRRVVPPARHCLAIVVMVAVVLAPWILWQKMVDPPGNVLTKSALAGGRFRFDESHVGLLQTIKDEYSKHTFGTWLKVKKDSMETLLGSSKHLPMHGLGEAPPEARSDIPRLPARVRGFLLLFPSLGWLPLALCAFALTPANWRLFRKPVPDLPKGIYTSVCIASLSLLLNVLVMWPFPIVHQLPYQAILLLVFALLLLLAHSSVRLFWLVGLVAILHGAVFWIFAPMVTAPRLDPVAMVLSCLAVAWGGLWFINEVRREAATLPPMK